MRQLSSPVMPASLYPEMEKPSGLEEQRAFQLALELSMLGLSSTTTSNGSTDGSSSSPDNDGLGSSIIQDEARAKKSQNMTECVPVPSSEHVAEIVGRQGCKIKALRAKTNTYIKTPVRGEEPVFVVTGRREDVTAAKREILSAAEHFSAIRAQRKGGLNGCGGIIPPGGPGQVTLSVRVPYRVVGLVVGPKGATIKRIQQQTHTYIVTPSRDKEPIFEVTGMPENVEMARKEIESHIAMRTGGIFDPHDPDDFGSRPPGPVGPVDGELGLNLKSLNSDPFHHHPSSSILPSNGLNNDPSGLYYGKPYTNGHHQSYPLYSNGGDHGMWNDNKVLGNSAFNGGGTNSISSGLRSILGNMVRSSSLGSPGTTTPRISPPPQQLPLDVHRPARRIQSEPHVGPVGLFGDGVGTPTSGSSPSPPSLSLKKRECMVCFDSEIVAALVPCGHNLFCMECAQRLCETPDGSPGLCPACHQPVTQAIRIFS